MPKLAAFHAQLMGEFTKSMLPTVAVSACSYALPFAELITGVLLLGALRRALGRGPAGGADGLSSVSALKYSFG